MESLAGHHGGVFSMESNIVRVAIERICQERVPHVLSMNTNLVLSSRMEIKL